MKVTGCEYVDGVINILRASEHRTTPHTDVLWAEQVIVRLHDMERAARVENAKLRREIKRLWEARSE